MPLITILALLVLVDLRDSRDAFSMVWEWVGAVATAAAGSVGVYFT